MNMNLKLRLRLTDFLLVGNQYTCIYIYIIILFLIFFLSNFHLGVVYHTKGPLHVHFRYNISDIAPNTT